MKGSTESIKEQHQQTKPRGDIKGRHGDVERKKNQVMVEPSLRITFTLTRHHLPHLESETHLLEGDLVER